jgi:CRP-like cAMP-binding protein
MDGKTNSVCFSCCIKAAKGSCRMTFDRNQLELIDIFHNIPSAELDLLLTHAKHLRFQPGDIIIEENSTLPGLMVILSGNVEVLKEEQKLSQLRINQVIGELSFIDNKKTSTSVKAVDHVEILFLPGKLLNKKNLAHVKQIILSNLCQHLANRLRNTNELALTEMQEKLQESKARLNLSILFTQTLLLFSLYIISTFVFIDMDYTALYKRLFSLASIFIFSTIMFITVLRAKIPLSLCGLTWKGWQKSLKEAVFFSVMIMLLLTVSKMIAINTPFLENFFKSKNIFTGLAAFSSHGSLNLQYLLLALSAYIAFCPLQEFISRGVMQSMLQNFLAGSEFKVKWVAIILSNLLFSLSHLHISVSFVFFVFPAGIFWGWLFARHQTLLGVTLSHIMLGVWVIFVLNFR